MALVCKTRNSGSIPDVLSIKIWPCGTSDSGKCTQYTFTVVKSHPGPQEIMAKNKKPTKKQEEDYMFFLKRQLDSKNYKSAVSAEEYAKTKAKYDKVKLKLRLL